MALEQQTLASDKTGMNIGIEQIGAAIGMDAGEAFRVARLLQDSEWVTIVEPHQRHVRMTIKGFEALEKLRRPRWEQWIESHPITVNVFWVTVTGVVYTVISYFLLKGR